MIVALRQDDIQNPEGGDMIMAVTYNNQPIIAIIYK